MNREELAAAFGISWFDYQLEAFDGEQGVNACDMKVCLFFRTGAGKTYTALALLVQAGVEDVTVVAPPATHAQWQQHAAAAGLQATCISHAKYRQPGTKFPRMTPVIVDEFHLLGGHEGQGWKKLRVHARGMLAPLLILSATPNYNDEERVYCVEHVLDPLGTKGGYLDWLYKNCLTQQNPYGKMPIVNGFIDGRSPEEHLAELPHTYYVEDPNREFPIADIVLPTAIPSELDEYGIDRRTERIVASRMELVSSSRKWQLIGDDGLLRDEVYEELAQLAGQSTKPVMVFCARATIARAAYVTAQQHGARAGLVVGDTPRKEAERQLKAFRSEALDVLFGTATMSTGVDGLDKVCDLLILLDDTDDGALRRQVIGRILPRGASTNIASKQVVRLLLGD